MANVGVLIVRDNQPFQPLRERNVVPRPVVDCLLIALHIGLCHPSRTQLKRIFNRCFFALHFDKAQKLLQSRVTNVKPSSLSQCTCGHSRPPRLPLWSVHPLQQMSYAAIASISSFFARLFSYTLSSLIDGERHDQLRNALLSMCAELRLLGDNPITVRVDRAPGFFALVKDSDLAMHGIRLEIGHVKNVNKNPVIENAIKELGNELLQLSPDGGPVSTATLVLATANLNSRIRRDGLSARDVWTQRDQITAEQLPITDRQLILNQYSSTAGNHAHSAKSKAYGQNSPPANSVSLCDLVYVKGDRDKCRARDIYIVTKLFNAEGWCQLRKFTTSQFRSNTYDVRISDCYTLTSALPNKPPDGPIRGQDMCSDSSSDSEPGSSELTSPNQVVAAEQPALQPLPPPPEAIVVHSTTPAANHTHPPTS